MKFTPHPYQQIILNHILDNPKCAVFAGMGMGKTTATLTAIDALYLLGELTRPVLVLAPKRVAQTTWPDEVKKWDHLSGLEVVPVLGTAAQRRKALRRDVPIHTINYDNIPWLLNELGGEWPYGMVVADEATRLKSFRLGGKKTRANQLGRQTAHRTPRWVNLTGTPSPNGLLDLWGQIWFLDRGQRLYTTYGAYQQHWFRPPPTKESYTWRPFAHSRAEIESRIADLCVTVRPEDWFDLDEPIEKRVMVQLPAKARALYEEMAEEMFTVIAGEGVSAVNAAVRTSKCRQIANGIVYPEKDESGRVGPAHHIHDAKLDALQEIIADAGGEPVLVAYSFTADRDRILDRIKGAQALDDKPETLRRWNRGEIPVLVAHPASCGHGINLQDGGRILVFYGADWNLEEHMQMKERLGPMRQKQSGYDRSVFYYYILAEDTLDSTLMTVLSQKKSLQDALMDALKRRRA